MEENDSKLGIDTEEEKSPEDIVLPKEKAEKIDQPKKKHRLRTFFIVLIIVLVVLLIGVAATGMYEIPGISSIMGTNKPKDLGIRTNPEAVVSISEKIPMKISGDYISYSANPSEIFSGVVEVDAAFDSIETTSWLERFEGTNPIFDNVQIKKSNGVIELSAMMKKYVKAPVYIKTTVELVGTNQISLDFTEGKFGMFNVPEKYLQQGEDFFENSINDLMNKIPGFSMEEYEIKDGKSYFKGTYPANARPTNEGWGGLFNL
jgi:hypothetical protein